MRLSGRLAAAAGFLRRHWLFGLYVLVAVGVTVQRLVLHKENVFRIFASASRNMLAGQNPYAAHPDQYFDFFRYSPAFAVAFTPFALVPEWLGLAAWNLVNALSLYWAVRRLLPRTQAQLVLLLVLGDLARTMQSCQSNGLVTALMIAAFVAYSGERLWRGAFAVAAGTAIKIFPLGAALFALLRRDRWRALGMLAAALAALALFPVVFVGPHDLLLQYARWAAQEHAETFKPMYSVMDLLDVWTGYYGPRLPIQLAGLALLLLPVALRWGLRDDPAWRLTLLCSLLVFSVLFNYGAEPPSFVIATTGIAVWYAAGRRTKLQGVLLGLTLVLVTGTGLGILPQTIHNELTEAAKLRVIPIVAAWIAIQWDLLNWRTVPALAPTKPELGLEPI
jgi:Glycosyltransferase family 87